MLKRKIYMPKCKYVQKEVNEIWLLHLYNVNNNNNKKKKRTNGCKTTFIGTHANKEKIAIYRSNGCSSGRYLLLIFLHAVYFSRVEWKRKFSLNMHYDLDAWHCIHDESQATKRINQMYIYTPCTDAPYKAENALITAIQYAKLCISSIQRRKGFCLMTLWENSTALHMWKFIKYSKCDLVFHFIQYRHECTQRQFSSNLPFLFSIDWKYENLCNYVHERKQRTYTKWT